MKTWTSKSIDKNLNQQVHRWKLEGHFLITFTETDLFWWLRCRNQFISVTLLQKPIYFGDFIRSLKFILSWNDYSPTTTEISFFNFRIATKGSTEQCAKITLTKPFRSVKVTMIYQYYLTNLFTISTAQVLNA